jgi:hypothetical protein
MSGWCVTASQMQGAEIECMCGGINSKQPTHGGLWRQGNLLHFGFEPSPSEYNETGRKLLVNAVVYISRFTTDRPIVRSKSILDPGPGASKHWFDFMLTSPKAKVEDLAAWFAAPWGEQIGKLEMAEARAFVNERMPALWVEGTKFTFDADALQLGVDLQKPGVVRQLADMLRLRRYGYLGRRTGGSRKALAHEVGGRRPGRRHDGEQLGQLAEEGDALCFDWHSHVWRVDPLAIRRVAKSADLRGPARADGDARRDPAAAELAAKVVAYHGGARAFDDLAAFSCRFGEIRCFWDRLHGLFRLENTGTIPEDNATRVEGRDLRCSRRRRPRARRWPPSRGRSCRGVAITGSCRSGSSCRCTCSNRALRCACCPTPTGVAVSKCVSRAAIRAMSTCCASTRRPARCARSIGCVPSRATARRGSRSRA